MPWHEWRLAGRSGNPRQNSTVKIDLSREFLPNRATLQALSELEMQVNVVDEILKMTVFEE